MIKLILNKLINYFLIVENHIDVQDQVNPIEYLPLKEKYIQKKKKESSFFTFSFTNFLLSFLFYSDNVFNCSLFHLSHLDYLLIPNRKPIVNEVKPSNMYRVSVRRFSRFHDCLALRGFRLWRRIGAGARRRRRSPLRWQRVFALSFRWGFAARRRFSARPSARRSCG